MLAALNNVDKFYGAHDVLSEVALAVHAGERLALVGRNGAGKSTVIRLFARLEEPSGGTVWHAPGIAVRLLEQDPRFEPGLNVIAMLDGAFIELDALEEEMKALEDKLEDEAALLHYHELEERYRLRGGYARRSRRDAVLNAFGFTGREEDPVDGLSGGERTRLALARILVAQPELLLLDEPTNHLDIAMLEWLERFLAGYPGAVVIISHDRAFLDAVATRTVLVEGSKLFSYHGNYSEFRRARASELELWVATYENERRELERLREMTRQMKIWGGRSEKLARRAEAMQTRFERFEANMSEPPPREQRVVRIDFPAPESGNLVLQAKHLSKTLGGRTLFRDVAVTLRRGDRVALVGRNGAGKSTLLKMLLGLISSDDARAELQLGTRVRLGYYDQNLRGVDEESTLYAEVRRLTSSEQETRDLLGAYLFPFDAQNKRIASLSGGERARLALLKLALEEHNLLVLDEPTNHLDMESLEALETALARFEGTLLLVSHDRRFVEQLAGEIWLIEEGEFFRYPGGWTYYKEKHRARGAESGSGSDGAPGKSAVPKPVDSSTLRAEPRRTGNPWQLRARLLELEQNIEALEGERHTHLEALASPNAETDFAHTGKRLSELEGELEAQMREWEEVARALEEIG